jgi:hypothetical protein
MAANTCVVSIPSRRIAEPVIGRAFARPVGDAPRATTAKPLRGDEVGISSHAVRRVLQTYMHASILFITDNKHQSIAKTHDTVAKCDARLLMTIHQD